MERQLLRVLKGLAEYLDVAFGELVEGGALHALDEARAPRRVGARGDPPRGVYGDALTAADSHHLAER